MSKRLNLFLKNPVISKIWDFRLNINLVVETEIHLATWLTVSCSVNLSTLFHLISLLFGGLFRVFPRHLIISDFYGGFKAFFVGFKGFLGLFLLFSSLGKMAKKRIFWPQVVLAYFWCSRRINTPQSVTVGRSDCNQS